MREETGVRNSVEVTLRSAGKSDHIFARVDIVASVHGSPTCLWMPLSHIGSKSNCGNHGECVFWTWLKNAHTTLRHNQGLGKLNFPHRAGVFIERLHHPSRHHSPTRTSVTLQLPVTPNKPSAPLRVSGSDVDRDICEHGT